MIVICWLITYFKFHRTHNKFKRHQYENNYVDHATEKHFFLSEISSTTTPGKRQSVLGTTANVTGMIQIRILRTILQC